MSLHDDIINIPHKRHDTQFANATGRLFYAEGHCNARHAAADIALQADARIEEMKNVFEDLMKLKAAKEQLEYLHKGMGTATEQVVWLRVEAYVKGNNNA